MRRAHARLAVRRARREGLLQRGGGAWATVVGRGCASVAGGTVGFRAARAVACRLGARRHAVPPFRPGLARGPSPKNISAVDRYPPATHRQHRERLKRRAVSGFSVEARPGSNPAVPMEVSDGTVAGYAAVPFVSGGRCTAPSAPSSALRTRRSTGARKTQNPMGTVRNDPFRQLARGCCCCGITVRFTGATSAALQLWYEAVRLLTTMSGGRRVIPAAAAGPS
jgi:hypothetical protein